MIMLKLKLNCTQDFRKECPIPFWGNAGIIFNALWYKAFFVLSGFWIWSDLKGQTIRGIL